MPKRKTAPEHPLKRLATATMAAAVKHGLVDADGRCHTVCEEITIIGADGVSRKQIVCRVICDA